MPINNERHEKLTKRIKEIDTDGEGLTEWEINFIADLIDNPRKSLSQRQEEIIDEIYEKRVSE